MSGFERWVVLSIMMSGAGGCLDVRRGLGADGRTDQVGSGVDGDIGVEGDVGVPGDVGVEGDAGVEDDVGGEDDREVAGDGDAGLDDAELGDDVAPCGAECDAARCVDEDRNALCDGTCAVGGCAPNEPGGCVDADEDGSCVYLDLDESTPTMRFAGLHRVGDDLYMVNCDLDRGRWRDFAEGNYVPEWSRCFGVNVCSWYDLEAWRERDPRPEFMTTVLEQCAGWTSGRIDRDAVIGGTGRACDPPDAPPPVMCWAAFVPCVDERGVIVDCDGTCVDTDGDLTCGPSER